MFAEKKKERNKQRKDVYVFFFSQDIMLKNQLTFIAKKHFINLKKKKKKRVKYFYSFMFISL